MIAPTPFPPRTLAVDVTSTVVPSIVAVTVTKPGELNQEVFPKTGSFCPTCSVGQLIT